MTKQDIYNAVSDSLDEMMSYDEEMRAEDDPGDWVFLTTDELDTISAIRKYMRDGGK